MGTILAPYGMDPPTPPSSDRLCRLYGRTAKLNGAPVPFTSHEFEASYGSAYGGASAASLIGSPLRTTANREGEFYVDLPRGTDVSYWSPDIRDPIAFRVPDADVVCLLDVLWPHPQRLQWFFSDQLAPPEELTLIPQDPPGFVALDVDTDYFVALGVVWSDCSLVPLASRRYAAEGFSEVEEVDPYTLRIQIEAGDVATLVSQEEDVLVSRGALWQRVGYDPANSPQWLPEGDYELTDTGVLTFTPA